MMPFVPLFNCGNYIIRGVDSNIEIQCNPRLFFKSPGAALFQPSGAICSTVYKGCAHLGNDKSALFCDMGSGLNNHILKHITGVYSRVHILHIPKRRIGYCNVKGAYPRRPLTDTGDAFSHTDPGQAGPDRNPLHRAGIGCRTRGVGRVSGRHSVGSL